MENANVLVESSLLCMGIYVGLGRLLHLLLDLFWLPRILVRVNA